MPALFTWADDWSQHDPFVRCEDCGEDLCTIEEGDTFVVIERLVRDHEAVCDAKEEVV